MASGWRFVLHGGCAETCPGAARQQHILRNLQEVSEIVSDRLAKGAKARDVVALAVSALEDRPVFNAGYGAALTRDGVHQLEAGIVDGASSDYGAVGCAEQTKNPILVAHSLSQQGPHVMLVGRPADEAARERGFDQVVNSHFTTPFRKAHWDQTTASGQGDVDLEMGTVGAVVLDSHGHIAAGGSTGGPTGKMNGRIGDTAILGAGLYADTQLGVVW
ncbi:N-terminal nucleophile aminohydrolase [Xylaria grammica]|nr:N-terminal nucleophile aminohydrolase [Xylaria grammica]